MAKAAASKKRNAPPNPSWWRGAVIYQIYPRSFADSNGDGIGDLNGITAHLDYVANLGVDAIWLSPFFKSPMKDFGYDVEDYCAVDPLFGTLKDFDRLVARAHKLGLKVMIDQVISHTADTHEWFKQSRASKTNPKHDWYVWADARPDGTPPNNWLSVFGGTAWAWDTRRCQYYLHNFLTSQPDLNFHNPDVRKALLKTVRFWLDRGVDGFRHDTLNFYVHDAALRDNPPAKPGGGGADAPEVNPYGRQQHIYDKSRPENISVLQELRALFDSYPDIAAVGEVGAGADTNTLIAAYTSGTDKFHMCYGFDLLGSDGKAAFIRKAVEGFEAAGPDSWICWALSNHDVKRAASRWGADKDSAAIASLSLALLLSLRGSACLYQGEELGLPEADVPFELLQDPYGIAFWPQFKGRDGCRTPMPWTAAVSAGFSSGKKPWLPIPQTHRDRAVGVQEKDAASALSRTRAFLHWRKTQPALITGAILFHDAPEPVLAFTRTLGNEAVLCLFNTGAKSARFALPADAALTPLTGHGFTARLQKGTVSLPARGAFFARVDSWKFI